MERKILTMALRLIREHFSVRRLSDLTGVDYSNMCAYVAGRKKLPLKVAFFVLDYLGYNCLFFRDRNNP